MAEVKAPSYARHHAAWPEHEVGQPLKWAEVDIARLQANAKAICEFAAPANVMAMIKANGYGHGALLAARAAQAGGAKWLGVSSPDEAFQLRDGGIDGPILVVGWSHPSTLRELIVADVDITVYSADAIESVARAAVEVGRSARIQIKLDSGMNRLGVRREEITGVAKALRENLKNLQIAGTFTHFADADGSQRVPTEEQHGRFLELLPQIADLAPDAVVHCSNSAATLRFPEFAHDMVRPGLALYGYVPDQCADKVDVAPAMTVATCVIHLKTIEAGEAVGYGFTWIAKRKTRVATIAAGYADGIHRAQSNRGKVMVDGMACPIIGRVSMDQTCVDVTDVAAVAVGDEAILFGGDGLSAEEVAQASGTISYEVLCAVSARVPRIVVGA